jgi:hypothetical protein
MARSERGHEPAGAGRAVGIIVRAQQARFGGDVFESFFLVPGVIAVGQHVHARSKQFIRGFFGDAGAVGDIFGVGHDEIELEALAQGGELIGNGAPSGLTDHVADKEQIHDAYLFEINQ